MEINKKEDKGDDDSECWVFFGEDFRLSVALPAVGLCLCFLVLLLIFLFPPTLCVFFFFF